MKKKAEIRPGKNREKIPNIYCLYITGASSNSAKAITNIKSILDRFLKNRYELTIVDVYQQPQVASLVDIIALPLLIRMNPPPERRLIGDMSDTRKIISYLEFETEANP